MLADCDGVLLTGGADVDPVEYGEPERHPTVELDLERDRYELALARAALAGDLPLLAICRGTQVLNVAAGGTLIQDIPSAQPTDLAHQVVSKRTQSRTTSSSRPTRACPCCWRRSCRTGRSR